MGMSLVEECVSELKCCRAMPWHVYGIAWLVAESIIPVCPPACGQSRTSDAAQISASMAPILITALIFFLHR
jgi:hypothetical protein